MNTLSRRAFIVSCGASALAYSGGIAYAAPDITTTEKIIIGDAKSAALTITKHVYGAGPLFVSLHANETTSVEVARKIVEKKGGTLVVLSQGSSRNISFLVGGVKHTADPNRIFTAAGVKKTLAGLSTNSEASERVLSQFGAHVLEKIGCAPKTLVVALHNNTEGSLSVNSYTQDKPFRQGVSAVAVVKENDPDDFFFVTEEVHYAALKNKGFNVVWQDKRSVEDDGSLSVYCAKHSIPYINVEAEHKHNETQKAMIEAVYAVL